MKFTAFIESNFYLGAGNNPNTNGIAACVCKDQTTNQDFIFGKVKFTPEEIELIKERGEIFIGIMGHGWPPMMPTVHNPFTEFPEGQKFVPYEI